MWDPTTDAFVYQLSPIDWWYGWSELDDVVAHIEEPTEGTRARVRAELERVRDHALNQFRRRTYWEGDITTGPRFAGLPPGDGNADGDVMVAIKQSNNGSVFVWSPYELPWISDYAV